MDPHGAPRQHGLARLCALLALLGSFTFGPRSAHAQQAPTATASLDQKKSAPAKSSAPRVQVAEGQTPPNKKQDATSVAHVSIGAKKEQSALFKAGNDTSTATARVGSGPSKAESGPSKSDKGAGSAATIAPEPEPRANVALGPSKAPKKRVLTRVATQQDENKKPKDKSSSGAAIVSPSPQKANK